MNTQLDLRRVVMLADHPAHAGTVARWHREEWGHLGPDRPLTEWTAQVARRANRDLIPITYLAFVGEQPAGSASLVMYDMDTRRDLSPWLAGVFVLPRFRLQGIASMLVTAVEEKAASLQVDVLYLYTNTAVGLYAKLGWRMLGSEPYQGRDVTIMQKALPKAAGVHSQAAL